jgi:hypothetical protein
MKRILPVYIQQIDLKNKFKKNQGIIIKISSYLNKSAYAQNITTFDKTKCNTEQNL